MYLWILQDLFYLKKLAPTKVSVFSYKCSLFDIFGLEAQKFSKIRGDKIISKCIFVQQGKSEHYILCTDQKSMYLPPPKETVSFVEEGSLKSFEVENRDSKCKYRSVSCMSHAVMCYKYSNYKSVPVYCLHCTPVVRLFAIWLDSIC